MADPILRTHILETPRPMNAWEFSHWESINRPGERYFMNRFHPEGSEREPYTPHMTLDSECPDRFVRWVSVYEEYDETTWGLIND